MVGVCRMLADNLLFRINLKNTPRKWSVTQCYCHLKMIVLSRVIPGAFLGSA